MVTLKQIASICGVSTATVSKALNRAPDIGVETAERIVRTAQEMGYYPNAVARTLKTNRSYSIGMLFEDDTHCGLTHEYFSSVLNAVKNEAENCGYDVTFICHKLGNRSMTFLEHCRYRRCDGVVIANVDFTDETVAELVNSDIPVVTIDFTFAGHSSVVSDNVQGMSELLSYVVGLGHRKIAYIHGETTAVTRARLDGFYQTAARLGLNVPEAYIRPARFHDPRMSGLATRELLALEERPTCILYPDDISLLGGMTEIERSGLSVPEDISIAGYDAIPLSRLLRPVLTTLEQDSEQLGRQAARLLVERIENPQKCQPQQVLVPGKIQSGKTVRRINEA